MERFFKYALLVVCAAVCACTSSKDVAGAYFDGITNGDKTKKTERIYVCLPTEVIHTNQTLNQMDNFMRLSEKLQDSIIKADTRFLNLLDDDKFIDNFAKNLVYHLERFGIPVTIVFNESELPQPMNGKIFTMNIVQIEAEEFLKQSRSEFTENDGTYYHYDYKLNGFSTNIWCKFSGGTDVYYKNFEVMDVFEGKIDKIQNKQASISGRFNRITMNDVYNTALRAGKTSAVLFAEKIINDYVKQQGYNDGYFVYLPEANEIIKASSVYGESPRNFKKLKEN